MEKRSVESGKNWLGNVVWSCWHGGSVMPDGLFEFEDCLLKHHVRTNGWLPVCKSRRQQINEGVKEKNKRRVRYFTFCAVGAIDVLMLDGAKVLVRSQADRFA